MKKILSILLLLIIISSMCIGCGKTKEISNNTGDNKNNNEVAADSSTNVTNPTEITFVFAGGDPLVKELTEERVDKFNSLRDDIEVIGISSGSGVYLDFIKTQDAIGEFPDMLDSRDTDVWVEADKLAELPQSVVDMVVEPPKKDGKYYIAPIAIQMASLGVYYNKKIFDELGLEEPKTYAEFEEICDKLLEAGIPPLVQGGKDVWHMGFLWSQFWNEKVFRDNPNWLEDKRQGKVSFTDDNVQEMLKKYESLYKKGYIEKGWLSTADNQISSFMAAEKAAMFFSGSWMIKQVYDADPEFEIGWFPLPDENGEISLIYGPLLEGFALSKEAAKDPNKVVAFEEFLRFWYDEENYVPYVQEIAFSPATDIQVTYDNPLVAEFAKAKDEAVFTDIMWNRKWGENALPGGFRNFAYKSFQDAIANGTDMMELGKLLDKQWDIEIAQTE